MPVAYNCLASFTLVLYSENLNYILQPESTVSIWLIETQYFYFFKACCSWTERYVLYTFIFRWERTKRLLLRSKGHWRYRLWKMHQKPTASGFSIFKVHLSLIKILLSSCAPVSKIEIKMMSLMKISRWLNTK